MAKIQVGRDIMPERVEPALALLKPKPPAGGQWIYEMKWDGYRLAVHAASTGVRIFTRGGHDWTRYFPTIAEAAMDLPADTLILDGEAVVLDEDGCPSFGLLQQDLGGRRATRAAESAILYAFDLLYIDGHDLRDMVLRERRHLLADLLKGETGAIRLSEEIEADGEEILRSACTNGMEGIIAKDSNSRYRSGRTGDWIKIKCTQSESFAVIGYEPSQKVTGSIASLLLAARRGAELVYVGSVGSGFSAKQARDLRKQLDGMRTDKPAAPVKGTKLVFVEPSWVAEVQFNAWTRDRRVRQASFKGLRDAADNAEIYEVE
ncbi:non-homologous end-joining DNA ligase [Phyllobacterium phragmitis]|uniref:DNA ligase (ATP) n=1 Tax=Phyllobacterium phragmitis TaxID=2670329 RepID=A0ABQ0H5D9_9HYPH